MGDRTITYRKCPKCGKEVEEYDAPSSLMFVAVCENCGWYDERGYWEKIINGNVEETILCTPNQAIEKGLARKCPICKELMPTYQIDEYGMCMWCHQDKNNK